MFWTGRKKKWGAWWSKGLRGTTACLHPRLFAEADGVLESMNARRLIDTSAEPGPGALGYTLFTFIIDLENTCP